MEQDKEYCDKNPKRTPIIFSNLDFISCVFFSNKQFNIEKIHKPQYSLCVERLFLSTGIESIQNEINSIIDNIYENLNKDNTFGKPIKIPAPIYILIGRELEYDSNLLENEKFIHFPLTVNSKLGNAEIIPDKTTGTLAIIDYMNSFFNNSGLATENDKIKYSKSHLNKYKFKGNIRILLYVPYLSNEYRYKSNIQDIINSATFFYNLIMSDVFLSFERTSNIDKEFINNLKKMNFNKKFINILVNVLREASKSKFLLYDDLNNLCFDGGCVSDVGEDLNVLIPAYNKDDGVNSENAVKYSPFLPNKCLSKTNNFLCNIRYTKEHNIGIDEFIKKYAMGDIINGLSVYSMINDMVNKKQISQENVNKIDKFKSPLNLIISIVNTHIKDGYSNDSNKNEREITVKEKLEDGTTKDKKVKVKYNHFSKEYSENMIKELSLLNDKYPGVPEIVMSLYIYNDTLKSDKITYMPWGKELISKEYILDIDTKIDVNTDLISFNNKYALKLNNKGYLFVYNINNKKILYFINYKKKIDRPIGLKFNKSEFIVECINNNNNQTSETFDSKIPKLIDDKCKECVDPFTMILDNDGYITIYGNSFIDATNKDFKKFINIQKDLVSNTDYNIDNIDDNVNQLDYIKQEYTFCSNIGENCYK
jgi:hypothetical protein